jgi:hypothetical protein
MFVVYLSDVFQAFSPLSVEAIIHTAQITNVRVQPLAERSGESRLQHGIGQHGLLASGAVVL